MTAQVNSGNADWALIVVNGKTVSAICVDGSTEDIMTCVNAQTAEYFQRKFNRLSKRVIDDAQYNRLCRAGD